MHIRWSLQRNKREDRNTPHDTSPVANRSPRPSREWFASSLATTFSLHILAAFLVLINVCGCSAQESRGNRWWWENIRRLNDMGKILMGDDPLLLSGKHEGDILLDPNHDPYSINAEEKNAVGDYSLLWPGGIVPYEFSRGYRMMPFEQFLITRAMRDIETKACVKFVQRTDEHDYVKIIFDSYKCYSNVGRRGGEQVLSLGVFCVMFYDRGNVYHELFHVLGFHHEHNRPDRDEYVDVMWRNIRKEARINFEKRHAHTVDLMDLPYDLDSVMHYSPHAFSKLYYVLPTLVSHDRGIFFTRSRWPSKMDYSKLNQLYQCHRERPFYPNQLIR